MIFCLNFVLSVNNIRSYLEGEAEIHAQDTATSLGMSLSPHMAKGDDPIIETTIRAIFDRGYYQEIKLINIESEVLVALSNNNSVEGVPDWFIEYFPMNVATAESEISSGWSISGVIFVRVNSGYAYFKLFEQVKSSFFFSLAAFIISIILLHIVLRMTLSSLRRIDQQALAISSGHFEIIEPLPWTTEVSNVAHSMNVMSRKIEKVITGLNMKLTGMGKKLHQDDLTGLYKKSSFETDMKHLLATNKDAFIFMIKVDGLNSLVKEFDRGAIDTFLKNFAHILTLVSQHHGEKNASAYRFFGSEFALLVKNTNVNQVEQIAKQLSAAFTRVGETYQRADIAHMGIVPFNPVGSTEGLLLAANEAYEQAQIIGKNSYYIRLNKNDAKDMAEWKSLVFDSVDNHSYSTGFVDPIECFKTGTTLMEEAFLKVTDKNGQPVSTGTFVSIAEKFAKAVELDKGVVLKVIEHIKFESIHHMVAINLSTRTIKNSSFRSWLTGLIKQNQAISQRLVFSLSAYAVAKEVIVYKEFIDFVHRLDAKVMIKRYETHSLTPEDTKYLKPDYIRLCRDLGKGVSVEEEKSLFIETMQEIAELLEISIMAENVRAGDDLSRLNEIGISGASR
jgi:EAL domain-containing protein (putative c-di-GMP-specific phosphodiesterase class I)/GGDEF domain-containing protein